MTTLTATNSFAEKPLGMNPKKFALWLFIVSITMIFASLTSAYIVKRAEDNWRFFDLPDMFLYSTAIIILSSITMQIAFYATKKDNFTLAKISTFITLVLGILFLYAQWEGWKQLIAGNTYFSDRTTVSGSFVYLISGLHGLHIVSAIIFVAIVLVRLITQKIHSKNLLSIDMCTTFWHFLDGLWLYLYFFLILFR